MNHLHFVGCERALQPRHLVELDVAAGASEDRQIFKEVEAFFAVEMSVN